MTEGSGHPAHEAATSLSNARPPRTHQKKARPSVSLSETRKLPITVNVYDLMPQSRLSTFMWVSGISICHSGVVINDEEWAFGGHDVEGVSGVYVTKPRAVPENAIYKTSITIGVTLLDDKTIRKELERLKKEYTGPSYDLLHKNCNHFVHDVCKALCGIAPPAWINRIAGMGAKLPLCVSEAWVNPPVAEIDDQDDGYETDSALLLPPSERAPMQRHQSTSDLDSDDDDDDDSQNDRYLTEASGGTRLSTGTK